MDRCKDGVAERPRLVFGCLVVVVVVVVVVRVTVRRKTLQGWNHHHHCSLSLSLMVFWWEKPWGALLANWYNDDEHTLPCNYHPHQISPVLFCFICFELVVL